MKNFYSIEKLYLYLIILETAPYHNKKYGEKDEKKFEGFLHY